MAIGIGAALFLGGTALSIMSNRKAAQAQADLSKQEAEALRSQSAEVLRRGTIDISNIKRAGAQVVADQQGAFIKGGVELSGTPMSVLFDTARTTIENILEKQRQIEFSQTVSENTAIGLDAASKRIEDAKDIASIAQAATGAGQLFMARTPNTGGAAKASSETTSGES